MIAISAFLLITLWAFALSEASHDTDLIAAQQPIDHGGRLVFRLVVAGSMFLIGWAAIFALTSFWWKGLLLAPMGWAWWTIWFRLMMNGMRDRPLWYLGVDSRYDWWWLKLAFRGRPAHPNRNSRVHWSRIRNFPFYRSLCMKAGLWAYGFEVGVLIVSVVLWLRAAF